MTTYWDSSALVLAFSLPHVKKKLEEEGGTTRTHTLAEVFSTLTGGRLGFPLDAEKAAIMIGCLSSHLTLVSLSSDETLAALLTAKSKGIRGARVHDFLHAVTAKKESCTRIYTLNFNDFKDIYPELEIVEP